MKKILILIIAAFGLCSSVRAETVYAFEATGKVVLVGMAKVELYKLNFDNPENVTEAQLEKLGLRSATVGEVQAWITTFGKGKLKSAEDRLLVKLSPPDAQMAIEFFRRRRASVASTAPDVDFAPRLMFPEDVIFHPEGLLSNILFIKNIAGVENALKVLAAAKPGYGYVRLHPPEEFVFLNQHRVAIQQWMDNAMPLPANVFAIGVTRPPTKL